MKNTSRLVKAISVSCLCYSTVYSERISENLSRLDYAWASTFLNTQYAPYFFLFGSFQQTELRIQATETARWEMKWQTFGLEILGISTMAFAYCSIVSLLYGLSSLPRPAFYTYLFGFLTWLPYSENHQVVMDCCIGENKYFPCQGVNISNSTLLTNI
jgi:hypothetical protein